MRKTANENYCMGNEATNKEFLNVLKTQNIDYLKGSEIFFDVDPRFYDKASFKRVK